MRVLVIDRTKWLRGEGHLGSMLFRPSDTKMCCLGFDCIAGGLDEQAITFGTLSLKLGAMGKVTDLPESVRWQVRGGDGTTVNSSLAHRIFVVNDNEALSEESRECQLTGLFAKVDVELQFIN
jgi:hypothetical protein